MVAMVDSKLIYVDIRNIIRTIFLFIDFAIGYKI